jgi:hypothetical protein
MVTLLARGHLPPFAVIGVVVLVVSLILQASRKREQLERQGRLLAMRLGGRFEAAGLFSHARIDLTLQDCPAVMTFLAGRQPRTHLRVWLARNPGGSLKISRDSIAQIFISIVEGRRYLVGDGLFDATYAVRSTPEALGQKIFSPRRRQEAMNAVRRLGRCFGLAVEIQPSWMEVRIRELADDPEIAWAMVRTAADFLGILIEIEPEPGIIWDTVVERMSGRCPICTSTLSEPIIRCLRCQTPHHQECWRYFGRCSTYGCDPRPGQRVA